MNQEGMKGGDGNLGEMRKEANFICLATVRAICFDKYDRVITFKSKRKETMERILLCFQ